MALSRVKVLGPNPGSLRRWIIAFAILAVFVSLLAIGIETNIPHWAQELSAVLIVTYLLGASVYRIVLYSRGQEVLGTELGIYPKSWRRWILDEGDESPRKR